MGASLSASPCPNSQRMGVGSKGAHNPWEKPTSAHPSGRFDGARDVTSPTLSWTFVRRHATDKRKCSSGVPPGAGLRFVSVAFLERS